MLTTAKCGCGATVQQIEGGHSFVKCPDGTLKLELMPQGGADAANLQQLAPLEMPKGHRHYVRLEGRKLVIGIEPIPTAASTPAAPPADGLDTLSHADLRTKAAELGIETKQNDSKLLLIGKIREKQAAAA